MFSILVVLVHEGFPAIPVFAKAPTIEFVLRRVSEEFRFLVSQKVKRLADDQIAHDTERVQEKREPPQRISAVPIAADQPFVKTDRKILRAGRWINVIRNPGTGR